MAAHPRVQNQEEGAKFKISAQMRAKKKCSVKNQKRMKSHYRIKWDKLRNIVILQSNLNENILSIYLN